MTTNMASLRANLGEKLVNLSDRVTAVVNEGRAADIIYLDLYKALDTFPHAILSLSWRDMDLMCG